MNKKLSKQKTQSIIVRYESRVETLFVTDLPYWNVTILQFSGLNAKNFYTLIKYTSVSGTFLSPVVFSRFDLYFEL